MTKATQLLEKAILSVHKPTPSHNSIFVALSGGVDSSVSSLILREAGWRVNPVLMRCWEHQQDDVTPNCFDTELRAAEATVQNLKLQPLQVFDFVKHYWTDVFDAVFLHGVRNGFMPNADLACNRYVKFGAFPARVAQLAGPNTFYATGHYARIEHSQQGPKLLAARDHTKDQSYFLASVRQDALTRAVLPVGDLLKTEVKTIAAAAHLPAANAKSSRGICFVGKRRMEDFIEQYLPGDHSGNFIVYGTEQVLGEVKCGYAFTIGQRARIKSLAEAMYVVGKRGRDVLVAPRSHHLLRSNSVLCEKADWIRGEPDRIARGHEVEIAFKACSTMPKRKGRIKRQVDGWFLKFEHERQIVAPGQAIVLYEGQECLGALWHGNGTARAVS